MSKIDELLEQLYDFDRDELRRLAWEALLISDGPDRVEGEASPNMVATYMTDGNWSRFSFYNYGE